MASLNGRIRHLEARNGHPVDDGAEDEDPPTVEALIAKVDQLPLDAEYAGLTLTEDQARYARLAGLVRRAPPAEREWLAGIVRRLGVEV